MISTMELRQRIEARRRQAEMLLSISTHDTARKQVRRGLRDLKEAVKWLDCDCTTSPVELLLELAAWRLNTVRAMLRSQGPTSGCA